MEDGMLLGILTNLYSLEPHTMISIFDNALRTLFSTPRAQRRQPDMDVNVVPLSPQEKALAGALMRVNHTGEVCAQALYSAQAWIAKDPKLRTSFLVAQQDEADHLAWTKVRLDALEARQSLLNPIWYAASFGLGLLGGCFGDRTSLGFVVETERQVEEHLADHLERLPVNDYASRAIVLQMQADEVRHGFDAQTLGAAELPLPIKIAMRAASKVMTTVAHFV